MGKEDEQMQGGKVKSTKEAGDLQSLSDKDVRKYQQEYRKKDFKPVGYAKGGEIISILKFMKF